MVRNILLIAGGIALSFGLMNAGNWIILHYTTYGAIERENPNRTWQEFEYMNRREAEMRQRYGGSYNELFWRAVWLNKAAINPLIALMVGVLIGLLARRRAWTLAMLSIVPFLSVSLGEPNAYLLGMNLLFCIGYLFVTITSAEVTARLLHGRMPTQA